MPTPRPDDETREEWMERCVPEVISDGTAEDADQAAAICATMWDEAPENQESAKRRQPPPHIRRAYSVLRIKQMDEDKRELTGIATTPETDRAGDIVEPDGAKYSLPIPFLWQHDTTQPIGHVVAAKVNKAGIEVKVKLAKIDEPGRLKDRLDEAWQSIKLGLVRGLSIGFQSIEHSFIEGSYGIRWIAWDWLELSAVTIPANADASIATIKSIDAQALAASGRTKPKAVVRLSQPAGASANKSRLMKEPQSMNIQEQIKSFEATRAAKVARLNEITEKAVEAGRSKDASEKEEFDSLTDEIKSIDEELKDLKTMEAINVQKAAPLQAAAGENPRTAAAARSPHIVMTQRKLAPGTAFTRYVMALARSKGNLFEASEFAKRWDNETPEVSTVLKAAVAAGTTTDADWAAKLVDYQTLASEFVELLRPLTILGRFGTGGVPSLRRVPFNVRMAVQTGGGTYAWVGEGAAKPVGALVIGEITLRWAKAAGIIVVTDELMRNSSPSVESVVRNDMLKGMAAFSDLQFIDPSVVAVNNVSPASITNGVTPVTATGVTAEHLRADLATLWDTYWTANLAPTSGVFIMSNRMAMRLSLLRNALGAKEFPDMTPLGGVLEGFPVIASEAVPASSAGEMIIFVNADDIFFSDDGPVTIDASREASLQMDSAPDEPTAAGTVLVSLWQRNLIGLRAERYMNWAKRRAGAVGYITDANYA